MVVNRIASYTLNEKDYLFFGKSYNNESCQDTKYIKMDDRKIYEFALLHVPNAMKRCLDSSGYSISQLNKIIIHQANEKMDDGIIKRLYQLYGIDEPPADVMPMSIHWLGNSSVATIPTLLDLVLNNEIPSHELSKGDIILFASVGAGMNVNAVCYRC